MRGEEDKQIVLTRNPYKRERIGTVDLLISTCSDWALLILKNIIFLFTKTNNLNEEIKCTKPSTSARVPWSEQQRSSARGDSTMVEHSNTNFEIEGSHPDAAAAAEMKRRRKTYDEPIPS